MGDQKKGEWKEEWKEILEEATIEDTPEKDSASAPVEAMVTPVEENKAESEFAKEAEDLKAETREEEVIDYEKKNKKEFFSRLVLIFVLGFLIGIAIKTEALKKVTIGYDDYLMRIKPQNYDINQLQKDVSKAQSAASEAQTPNADANPNVDSGEQSNQTQN